ncbi:AAA family ATPase [Desulfotomaculum defluvii]
MDNYQLVLRDESLYLEKVLDLIRAELNKENDVLVYKKNELIQARRDMWENTGHAPGDFTKLTEMNQYLAGVNDRTANYLETSKQIERYRKILPSPYFGRFDFIEEGFYQFEKIYVGLTTLLDPETENVYVYDWRAPISSIYYRYEQGPATYEAPVGLITGEVILKRQYKIQDSQLKYFFDCSIPINDGVLQEILGHNASPKMRTIVETIQREQDLIIRDLENELLIVQGVAGSGKTSIALHRIAFLLYNGLHSGLDSHNMIIISPNATFSNYISSVLPELGEENVRQTTFYEIVQSALGDRFRLENRESQLESIIQLQGSEKGKAREKNLAFKGSRVFHQILERLLWHFQHRLIPFEDIYFNGVLLETRQQLKNRLLNDKTGLPLAKKLLRLESIVLDKVRPLRKLRLARIEELVAQSEGHELEIKSFSRLLSIKEAKLFRERLQRFTRVDYWQLYNLLFQDHALFYRLARGLQLPEGIEQILSTTAAKLQKGEVLYEDCAPLLYLKLKIEGGNYFSDIKQVVIDEAQDYYPLQYEIFKLLFDVTANYTFLGDVNQIIEKNQAGAFYDEVALIMQKQRTIKLSLHKSYRSSYEINMFCKKLLGEELPQFISFERHGEAPRVVAVQNVEEMDRVILEDAKNYLTQRYETIALVCKGQQEATDVYERLKSKIKLTLIQPMDGQVEKGVMVIPSYIAKGLEFDVVLVINTNRQNYHTSFDRQLLYIACTRAQHRLVLYYTGQISPFLANL